MNKILIETSMDGISMDRIIRNTEFTMATGHFHDEYEIYYLMEGERYYFIENKTYHIHKGSLVLINRRSIHKTANVGSSSYHDRYLIELKKEPLSSFMDIYGEIPLEKFFKEHNGVLRIDKNDQPYIEQLLYGISDEIRSEKPGYRTLAMLKLCELLVFVQRTKTNKQTTQDNMINTHSSAYNQINEIAMYISEHYTDNISLDNIAKHFFISKSYLSRRFKEVTGFAVNEYINLKRIKYSQELLADKTLNITAVSEKTGYNSITYFEKTFKRCTGFTPRQYRNNLQSFLRPVRLDTSQHLTGSDYSI